MKNFLLRYTFLLVFIPLAATTVLSQNNELCSTSLPAVSIKPGVVCPDAVGKKLLDTIARMVIDNPGCQLAIISYSNFGKRNQQLSWDRVNQVILYFSEKKGIRYERLIFLYAQEGGDINTLEFRLTQEEGPSMVPQPYAEGSLLKTRSGKCL